MTPLSDTDVILDDAESGQISIDRRVGARIRRRREEMGLTPDALAARLGWAPVRVRDYESGRARAGATALLMLTRTCDVDVAYFLAGLDRESDDDPVPEASH